MGDSCAYAIFSRSYAWFGEKDKARARMLGIALFPWPCPLSAMSTELCVLSSHTNWCNSKKKNSLIKDSYKSIIKGQVTQLNNGEGILMTNGLKQQVTSSSASGNAD